MSLLSGPKAASWVQRLDPAARLLAALVAAFAIASLDRLPPAGGAAVAGLFVALAARLPAGWLFRRLRRLNLLLLLLVAILPLSVDGGETVAFLGLATSRDGWRLAASIALRANAIVLLLSALMANGDPHQLGEALQRLRLPAKLVLLAVLTIRYIEVIRDEYARLRRSMRARAFRPSLSRHALRTLGYLVGMLLVRGMTRADRLLWAMKCRGFTARFPLLATRPWRRHEVVTLTIAAIFAVLLCWFDRPPALW